VFLPSLGAGPRGGPPAAETAGLHHRQKYGDLIQSRGFWLHLFNFLEQIDRDYTSFQNKA
jgi:hypothetical protein